MIYCVDSNIFLRVTAKESEKTFEECSNFLKLVKSRLIIASTSSLALAEVVWTLKTYYKLDKPKIVKTLEGIEKLGIKITDYHNSRLAFKIFKKYNIKYIDALISSIPQIYTKKWALVSYDGDFDRLKVKRLEPKEINKNFKNEESSS